MDICSTRNSSTLVKSLPSRALRYRPRHITTMAVSVANTANELMSTDRHGRRWRSISALINSVETVPTF